VIEGVQTLHQAGTASGLSDTRLLDRFLGRRDAGAEAAFAAVVARHGPMVHRVCREVLRESNDADDAFQAAFLILARKAGSIRERGSIASWLYGVARRVALRLAAQRARRSECERAAGALTMKRQADCADPGLSQDVQDELDRLPAKYRSAVILCDLEGLTHERAAQEVGVPVGTLKVRLWRARRRLRERLTRRGLAPAFLGAACAARGSAAVSAPLVDSTVKAAMQVAAGQAAAVSTPVALLVKGVLRAMFVAKLKTMIVVIAGCLPLILAVGLAVRRAGAASSDPPPVAGPAEPASSTAPEQPRTAAAAGHNIEAIQRIRFAPMIRHETMLDAHQSVAITSSVSGTVKRVLADLGDHVKKGQLLVELEAPELADDIEEARAMVELETARLRQVESRLGKGGASATTEADHQLAVAQLKVAQVRLRKLENRMAAFRLTSPIDGVISRRTAHVGENVRAESGNELLVVADLTRMRAEIFVGEDEIRELDKAARVVFRSESKSEQETTGKVVRKAVGKEGTGDVRAILEFENASNRFRPGQKGMVTIELPVRSAVITIPIQAIAREDGNGHAWCFRVVEGRAVLTDIKLGLAGHEATREQFTDGQNASGPRLKVVVVSEVRRVEVVDGLSEGDRVLWNTGQIKDGQKVEISK
jgi:RND family efflux transporter MFP subunit